MTIYIVEVGPGYEAADEVVAFSKRADAEAYVAHIEAEPDYRGRLGTNWTRITEVVVDSARVSRDAANWFFVGLGLIVVINLVAGIIERLWHRRW